MWENFTSSFGISAQNCFGNAPWHHRYQNTVVQCNEKSWKSRRETSGCLLIISCDRNISTERGTHHSIGLFELYAMVPHFVVLLLPVVS
jgi:hypothetical protein